VKTGCWKTGASGRCGAGRRRAGWRACRSAGWCGAGRRSGRSFVAAAACIARGGLCRRCGVFAFGSAIGLFISAGLFAITKISDVPAGAFELKARGRDLFFKTGLPAGGADRQQGIRDFLQNIFGVPAGIAFVSVNRHVGAMHESEVPIIGIGCLCRPCPGVFEGNAISAGNAAWQAHCTHSVCHTAISMRLFRQKHLKRRMNIAVSHMRVRWAKQSVPTQLSHTKQLPGCIKDGGHACFAHPCRNATASN
jgi:hypothetical protein